VVHELAHQWAGDYLALAAWQHIWLNEGFASYAEWLWSEYKGRTTAQQFFDFYTSIPADSPFWTVTIGDPGPDDLFDSAVYDRGASTLHALRLRVGDETFLRIVRRWIRTQAGGHVTTPELIALAEHVSGQQLDEFFDEWLFTPTRPPSVEALSARTQSRTLDRRHVRPAPHARR
jgi:aminopeptidase N